jgi:hypothetical protein
MIEPKFLAPAILQSVASTLIIDKTTVGKEETLLKTLVFTFIPYLRRGEHDEIHKGFLPSSIGQMKESHQSFADIYIGPTRSVHQGYPKPRGYVSSMSSKK